MGFMIGQWYNDRDVPQGYTLAQIVDLAKAKGAIGIRLYARAGMEAIDYARLNTVLDMLQSKGMKVLFCPFLNWQDHAAYFGSAAFYTAWTTIANNLKNDPRIWAFQLFNEPNPSTWATGITSIPQVQAAIAQAIDTIRATGDNHPIVLPDCNVYSNWTWAYPTGMLESRPNLIQSFHFWMSTWAATTYGTGLNFWQQWGLARIESLEATHPDIHVIVDEVGVADDRIAGYPPWALQSDAMVACIDWCLSTGHDFSWHLYGRNFSPTGTPGAWYLGKADVVLAKTTLGTPQPHQCPIGSHWDEGLQICIPDVINYILTIETVAGGVTTPSGASSQQAGTKITITATAATANGYVFAGWEINGQLQSVIMDNPLIFNINADTTVTPIFKAPPTLFTLTILASTNGTTNPLPGIHQASSGSFSVTAISDSGYVFDHWLVDGVSISTQTVIVNFDADHTVQAFFVASVVPPPPSKSLAARTIGPFGLPSSVVHALWTARERVIRPEVHKRLHPLV